MRIGVEADVLARRVKTGVDYYTRGLLRATAPLLPDDALDLCYFGHRDIDLGVVGPNVRSARMPPSGRLPYRLLDRYLWAPPFDVLSRVRDDIFVFPDFVAFRLARAKRQVVIIYDLAFIDLPQFYRPDHQRFLAKRTLMAAAEADAVVAISAFTKRRVCEAAAIRPEKVVIIEPGVDHDTLGRVTPGRIDDVRHRHRLPARYVLFVGTLTGRKNAPGLISSYRRLPADIQREVPLVLVGRPGWQDDGLEAALRETGPGQVMRLGYVDQAEMPALYAGAAVFVYPSLYEGFGMPVVEAMAAGTAVITSDTTSLPEAAGEAAVLVDPTDSAALAAALEQVLSDEATASSLRERGRSWSARFTWDRSAASFAGLLRGLAP